MYFSKVKYGMESERGVVIEVVPARIGGTAGN